MAQLPLEIQTDNRHPVNPHGCLFPVDDWEILVLGLVEVDTRGHCSGSDGDVDMWRGLL